MISRNSDSRESRLRWPAARWPHMPRHLALVGGSSTAGDCLAALGLLLRPGRLTRGPAIAALESAFARAIGVGHAVSFASARVGLYATLRALGVGPGDEVLLPLPTHIVVANAIRYTGAAPVFIDCRPDSLTLDLAGAEAAAGPAARVLLLQHTFGIPCDLDAAQDLARRRGLILIEDCVHALGATYRGRPVGSFGRAACFSTEETKTISSTMGGLVVTDDGELAGRLRAFQAQCAWPSAGQTARYLLKFVLSFALTEPHLHRPIRALYELGGERHPLPRPTSPAERRGERPPRYAQRLSNAQAALALRQLRRLGVNVAHRRLIAGEYEARLSAAGLAVPRPPAGANPAYVRYPVWVADRGRVVAAASRRALLGIWFTSVLEEAASPGRAGYVAGSCPWAERAARHLINLPTHQRVRPDDAAAIVDLVVDTGGSDEDPDC